MKLPSSLTRNDQTKANKSGLLSLTPKFMRYLFIGSITNITDILIYSLLLNIGIYYLFSSMIASGISVSMNFFLHRGFTFGSKGSKRLQVPRFVLVLCFNYVVTQFILFVLVDIASIDEFIAKIGSLLFVISYNFMILNRWVFKKSVV